MGKEECIYVAQEAGRDEPPGIPDAGQPFPRPPPRSGLAPLSEPKFVPVHQLEKGTADEDMLFEAGHLVSSGMPSTSSMPSEAFYLTKYT